MTKASRQSLRKDFIAILLDNWFYLLLIGTHFPEEPKSLGQRAEISL